MSITEERLSAGKVKFKRISEETLNLVKSLDMVEFATAMGDNLKRSGKSWMAEKNGGENTNSVAITPSKGLWADFTRPNISGHNVLTYYAYRVYDSVDLKVGDRFIESIHQVCAISGLPVIYEDGSRLEPEIDQRVKAMDRGEIELSDPKADDATLDAYYRCLLNSLNISDKHRENFMDVRGMTAKEYELRGYRSCSDNIKNRWAVTRDVIKEMGREPDGIPGFYQSEGKDGHDPYWSFWGKDGYFLPFRNLLNQITGLQLRLDYPWRIETIGGIRAKLEKDIVHVKDNASGEMIWKGNIDEINLLKGRRKSFTNGHVEVHDLSRFYWCSTKVDKKRGYLKGCEISSATSPAPYHVAVPSALLDVWETGTPIWDYVNTKRIWWGEGPIKGDIAAEITNEIHLQCAGIKSYRVLFEPTLAISPEEVVVAFDADAQRKDKDVGETLITCLKEAEEFLSKAGIKLILAVWPENQGKGIDDLFKNMLRPNEIPLN
jgi:hypothetical protein